MDNITFKSIKKIVLKGKFKGSVYEEILLEREKKAVINSIKILLRRERKCCLALKYVVD